MMITQEEVDFLKREKWAKVNDEDGSINSNPTMMKTLSLPLEDLNKDSTSVSFLKAWVKRLKERQNDSMLPFVWNENDPT